MTRRTPLVFLALAVFTLAAFTLSGCRGNSPAEPRTTAADGTSAARVDVSVHLDPSQLRQVHVEPLSAQPAGDVIKTTGVVEINADRTARIIPPVAGQVRDLAVNAGDTVAKASSGSDSPADSPANCPICRELAQSGAYLASAPVAFDLPAPFHGWQVASIVSWHHIAQPPLGWRSRAPPLQLQA